jgi:hypothetical protein
VGVSLGCLLLATRGTDWREVGRVLWGADASWAAAVVLASVWTYYIRAQRWRLLLRPVGDVPLGAALSATCIGFGASAVLPFRLGELVRPALLARRTGVAMSAALSTVVVERLFDMLLVIVCFLGVALLYPLPANLRLGVAWLTGIGATGFVALLAAHRYRTRAAVLVAWVVDRAPAALATRLRPLVEGFLDGLGVLASGRMVVATLGYSVYLWLVIALTWGFGLLALDIRVPLIVGSLAAMVVVAAFVFLPQGPGFVGTWQAGSVLALNLFGVPQEQAVGYSVLTWIIMMIANIGVAGVFLAREDIPLSQLIRSTGASPGSARDRAA